MFAEDLKSQFAKDTPMDAKDLERLSDSDLTKALKDILTRINKARKGKGITKELRDEYFIIYNVVRDREDKNGSSLSPS